MIEEELAIKEQQEINKFKKIVTEKIPGIDALQMYEVKWNQLKKNVGEGKISSTLVFRSLSGLFNKSPENLQAILTHKKSLYREAKLKSFSTPNKSGLKRSWSTHSDSMDENSLILEKKEQSSTYDSPIRKIGVRMEQLQPATPVKGYSEVKRTPENNSKVYRIYSNNQASLYKKLTPEHQKLKLKDAIENHKISSKPRALFKEQPGPISYLATQAQYKESQGVKRRCQQKQVTGLTCLEVFKDHSADILFKPKGHHYHWAHLIAHFLGGQQTRLLI